MRAQLTVLLSIMAMMVHGQVNTVTSNKWTHAQEGDLDVIGKGLLQHASLVDSSTLSHLDPLGGTVHLTDPSGWLPAISAPEGNWEIGMDNFYASGQAASYFGAGWFSNLRAERRMTVMGLPVRLSGDAVIQNNQLNKRLSSLSVEFDYQTFLNKFRNQAGQLNLQHAFARLSADEQALLHRQSSLEHWQEVIQSKAFNEGKAALQTKVDSLEKKSIQSANGFKRQGADSLAGKTFRRDSVLLDSLKRIQREMSTSVGRLDSLYRDGLKHEKEILSAMNKWQHHYQDIQTTLEEKIKNGTLNTKTDSLSKLGGSWMKWLSSISQFTIGTHRINGSPFDVAGIPVHGIGIEVRRNGYYLAAHYGQEGQQNTKLPDYVRNLRLNGQGRTILQVKAGIGAPETNHLHLALTEINLPGDTSHTVVAYPKRNVLLTLDSRYMVGKSFFMDGTVGASNSDFSGKTPTQELLNGIYTNTSTSASNLATLVRAGWKNEQLGAEWSAGYQTVGSNFVTLGNLFLLSNRNALRLEGRQHFLRNKGEMRLTWLHGASNGSSNLYPGIKQDQLSGYLSYRFDRRGSRIWASYSPAYFLQSSAGSLPSAYQINLTTAGIQIMYPHAKGKGQWVTVFQGTNFADHTQFNDTSTVTGLAYGTLTNSFIRGKYTLTSLTNIGANSKNLRQIHDWSQDFSHSLDLGKIQITQGIQALKRFYDANLYAGGSAGIHCTAVKRLRFGANATYLFGLTPGSKNQIYVNTTLSTRF